MSTISSMLPKHIIIGCLLLLLGSANSFAQMRIVTALMASAENHLNNARFKLALNDLEKAISSKEDYAAAWRLKAYVLHQLGRPDEAVTAYQKTFELSPMFSRAAYFECAVVYHRAGLFDKAKEYFELYQNTNPRDYKAEESGTQRVYDALVKKWLRDCDYSRRQNFQTVVEIPQNLGTGVNSDYEEYMPSLSYEGDILVFTRKAGDENILLSRFRDNKWQSANGLPNINGENNEGMARFSPCGRKLYFTGCDERGGQSGCDIWCAAYKRGQFEAPEKINGALNHEYWDSQPSISCDGNTMYFASNRPGGFGGTDIWYCKKDVRGYWTEPKNLGININTELDEETPCLANDGQTLYFSSDGWPGFGESDIFRSTVMQDGEWSPVMNLGRSVNSSYREVGFTIDHSEADALFASDRPGGEGGLDLYRVGLSREISPVEPTIMVTGSVYEEEGGPLEAQFKVSTRGKTIRQFQSEKDGTFFLCLPDKEVYSFIVSKPGLETYVNAEEFIRTPDEPARFLRIVMQKARRYSDGSNTKEKTSNHAGAATLYYESSKATLGKDAQMKLDILLGKFTLDNTLRVFIIGYADETGDPESNLALSAERAENIKKYLMDLGIPEGNISSHGKGVDERDINEPQYQKRRVEIIVNQ